MIATIVKHQWFSGSPLPLNEWFGRNHWYQWFFNGFWSINHWPRCFFSLATIGLDGFAMVFGLATIGLDGFSMVANHWSNDGMVTIHRSGLKWGQSSGTMCMPPTSATSCRTMSASRKARSWNHLPLGCMRAGGNFCVCNYTSCSSDELACPLGSGF